MEQIFLVYVNEIDDPFKRPSSEPLVQIKCNVFWEVFPFYW